MASSATAADQFCGSCPKRFVRECACCLGRCCGKPPPNPQKTHPPNPPPCREGGVKQLRRMTYPFLRKHTPPSLQGGGLGGWVSLSPLPTSVWQCKKQQQTSRSSKATTS